MCDQIIRVTDCDGKVSDVDASNFPHDPTYLLQYACHDDPSRCKCAAIFRNENGRCRAWKRADRVICSMETTAGKTWCDVLSVIAYFNGNYYFYDVAEEDNIEVYYYNCFAKKSDVRRITFYVDDHEELSDEERNQAEWEVEHLTKIHAL